MIDASRFDGLIVAALDEDLSQAGDLTTESVIPVDATSVAVVVARAAGVVAGLPIAARVFEILDPDIEIAVAVDDGAEVEAGSVLMELDGPSSPVAAMEQELSRAIIDATVDECAFGDEHTRLVKYLSERSE